MASPIEVRVPDIGGFKDVSVIDVLVKDGQQIDKETPLVTIETEKAAMDVPAPVAGKIAQVKLKTGDKVSEGSVILLLEALRMQCRLPRRLKRSPAAAAAPSDAQSAPPPRMPARIRRPRQPSLQRQRRALLRQVLRRRAPRQRRVLGLPRHRTVRRAKCAWSQSTNKDSQRLMPAHRCGNSRASWARIWVRSKEPASRAASRRMTSRLTSKDCSSRRPLPHPYRRCRGCRQSISRISDPSKSSRSRASRRYRARDCRQAG